VLFLFPVCIVGSEQTVPIPRIPIRADVKVDTDQTSVAIRGAQTEGTVARPLQPRQSSMPPRRATNPSAWPAFEAAFSRCAIVANDIPELP
jgi:hypothetical protein